MRSIIIYNYSSIILHQLIYHTFHCSTKTVYNFWKFQTVNKIMYLRYVISDSHLFFYILHFFRFYLFSTYTFNMNIITFWFTYVMEMERFEKKFIFKPILKLIKLYYILYRIISFCFNFTIFFCLETQFL